MSLFGTQYSHSTFEKSDKFGRCCMPVSTPDKQPKRVLLLGNCKTKEPCDNNCNFDPEAELESTASGFVGGKRVLRPWAATKGYKNCCSVFKEPIDPCAGKNACNKRKTKIQKCKISDCGSTLIKMLVQGGPSQTFVLLVPLAACPKECEKTEIAFCAHSIVVGEGKCVRHCQVPCDFVKFTVIKDTPSGAQIEVCFIGEEAPASLNQTEEPCNCPVPFCVDLEIWRRPATDDVDCCEIETVIALPSNDSNCDQD